MPRAECVPLEEAAAPEYGMVRPEPDEHSDECQQFGVSRLRGRSGTPGRPGRGRGRSRSLPVNPGDLVVLAVGVVVALLGAAHLVACEQHRDSLREQQRREEVALLPLPQRDYCRAPGRALDAAVPRPVVVAAIPVVLTV